MLLCESKSSAAATRKADSTDRLTLFTAVCIKNGPGITAGPFFNATGEPATVRLRVGMADFLETVRAFIAAERLFDSDGGVVIAASGGADSTALMHVLSRLREQGEVEGPMVCAHVNHLLRGGSANADERFVIDLARELGLEAHVRKVDVRGYASRQKISIETAGREVRIAQLKEIAESRGCRCIATGHHKDDNAETVIQRLSRGTGYRGLAGIRPRQAIEGLEYGRPLLCVDRRQITEYLRSIGADWCEDSTNASCVYRRNFIRHRLLPGVEKDCSEPLSQLLWRLSRKAGRLQQRIDERVAGVWDDIVQEEARRLELDAGRLMEQSAAVRFAILRKAVVRSGCGLRDYTRRHYAAIVKLAESAGDSFSVTLPGDLSVRRRKGRLVFCRPQDDAGGATIVERTIGIGEEVRAGSYRVKTRLLAEGQWDLGEFIARKDDRVEWMDAGRIAGSLSVRSRKAGDRFVPLGRTGEKKVGKFLSAARLSRKVRSEVLIVRDERRIVWVYPVRASEAVRITESTRTVLEIDIR